MANRKSQMKLLVFAHVPPPHHGQSYMVQLMLDGFGGNCRRRKRATPNRFGIACYHVNARFSRGLEDVGAFQSIKLARLFLHCLEAIWCRFYYGVENLYYVPAPGKRVALYRDWLVMLFCRPFFKRVILHWHAAGLAKWLETSVQMRTRAATYRLFKPVDLSLVLSRYNFADAEKLLSRRIAVVNNGIPDPCPDFEQTILPRRRARRAARVKLFAGRPLLPEEIQHAGGDPETVKVLFLAHCSRDKGLFATVEAIGAANRHLAARGVPVRMKLTVAGSFVTVEDRETFNHWLQKDDLHRVVEYLGFVSGADKDRVLREADLFCFPTHYLGENQPVNLIEAMAFGLPVVVTRWRSLPEMLPDDYPGLVSGQSSAEVAAALVRLATEHTGEISRRNFVVRYTLQAHLNALAAALRQVETEPPTVPAEAALPLGASRRPGATGANSGSVH